MCGQSNVRYSLYIHRCLSVYFIQSTLARLMSIKYTMYNINILCTSAHIIYSSILEGLRSLAVKLHLNRTKASTWINADAYYFSLPVTHAEQWANIPQHIQQATVYEGLYYCLVPTLVCCQTLSRLFSIIFDSVYNPEPSQMMSFMNS